MPGLGRPFPGEAPTGSSLATPSSDVGRTCGRSRHGLSRLVHRRDACGGSTTVSILVAVLVAGLLAVPVSFAVGGLPPAVRGAGSATAGPKTVPSMSQSPRTAPPALASVATSSATPLPVPNRLVVVPCPQQNAEVQQAYDPAHDVLYEVWIGCGNGIGFARSLDGGTTFQPAFAVLGSVDPTVGSYSWDPAIALAPNGTVYVSFVHYNATSPGTNSTVVAWSYDQGASFQGWAYVAPPSATAFYDRDFLAVGPNGTLYVTWDLGPNGSMIHIVCPPGESCYFSAGDLNIVFSVSVDGGRSWSSPRPLTPNYPNGGGESAPLLVDPSGALDVLYEELSITNATTDQLGPGGLYFVRSVDGGSSWTSPVRLPGPAIPSNATWIDGAISLDPAGTLYVGFDAPAVDGLDHRYLAFSSNEGGAWTLADLGPPTTPGAVQEMVTPVGVAPGRVDVAWMTNSSVGKGWSTYLQEFSWGLLSNSTIEWSLFPAVLVSDGVGGSGHWVGDTIGLTYLRSDLVAVSWSYQDYFSIQACLPTAYWVYCQNSEVWEAVTTPFWQFAVTFREHHLPAGVSWSVTADGVTDTNVTAPVPGSSASAGLVSVALPDLLGRPANFSLQAPVGYGIALLSGPGVENQTSGVVVGPAHWNVYFGAIEPVFFNESSLPGFAAYPLAVWSVGLTALAARGGPGALSVTTNGTSLEFLLPAGAAYEFVVEAPGPEYRALPGHGGLHVPPHVLSKVVRFKLLTEKVVFRESGLTPGTNWTITFLNGSSPAVTFPLSATRSAGTGSLGFFLPVGTYNYTVSAADGQTPSTSSGTVVVVTAPSSAQIVAVTFA